MNILRLYPKFYRKFLIEKVRLAGYKESAEAYNAQTLRNAFIATFLGTTIVLFLHNSLLYIPGIFFGTIALLNFLLSMKAADRIKKMETLFPDIISLMASNLRAGITVDHAFLLSARQEFYPLNEEILKAGKEIATGIDTIQALDNMRKRIGSEKVSKTISLIISGLRAGGNIADLLEQTAANLKEKEIIEKKAASNIAMYVIFIMFAIGAGAPMLFGLSTVLVEIITDITSRLPDIENQAAAMPVSFQQLDLDVGRLIGFSITFMILTNLISCLVMGLVNKGAGREGLKYFLPLTVASIIIFFVVRTVLSSYMVGIFQGI